VRYIIMDLESYPIDNAADYLTEPVEAPSNYVKQEAKDAFIAKAKQAQLDKAALDVDLARIVCLGMLDSTTGEAQTFTFKDETQERTGLGAFFDAVFTTAWHSGTGYTDWPILVTYNGLFFDMPLIMRRAMYLGVRAPQLQLDRFKHPHVIDLMDVLNYGGRLKSKSLHFYCQRFGIPLTDENTGKDIAALIAADNWAAVEAHCASDVQATYALAKRMGVLNG
jgi:hypothetical protein